MKQGVIHDGLVHLILKAPVKALAAHPLPVLRAPDSCTRSAAHLTTSRQWHRLSPFLLCWRHCHRRGTATGWVLTLWCAGSIACASTASALAAGSLVRHRVRVRPTECRPPPNKCKTYIKYYKSTNKQLGFALALDTASCVRLVHVKRVVCSLVRALRFTRKHRTHHGV